MNAIKFENTKHGFKAQVVGMQFSLRQINRPDQPALYFVSSADYAESMTGDLIDAREWLTDIARNHADAVGQ